VGRNTLFSVTVDDEADTIRISPRGVLDTTTVPGFERVVTACEQEPLSTILLDLRNVTSLDSTGLHALQRAWNRSLGNGHRLFVVSAPTSIRKVLELTGIGSALDEREATVSPIGLFTRPWDPSDSPADPGDLRAY
jgi:anti-anti-sigma factor